MGVAAIAQVFGDVIDAPAAETRALVARQIRRCPVIEFGPIKILVRFCRAQGVERRMARAAVTEAIDDVRAAIPVSGLAGIGLEIVGVEIEKIPTLYHESKVQWKAQIVRWRGVTDRRRGFQIGQDGV